jgi:4-hydroxy-tetrahydrodipicolinate synthase
VSDFAADPAAVRGAITPLVTPFHPDGSLDLDAVERLVSFQLKAGSHGISVGG